MSSNVYGNNSVQAPAERKNFYPRRVDMGKIYLGKRVTATFRRQFDMGGNIDRIDVGCPCMDAEFSYMRIDAEYTPPRTLSEWAVQQGYTCEAVEKEIIVYYKDNSYERLVFTAELIPML